jgi:hypothetical protein
MITGDRRDRGGRTGTGGQGDTGGGQEGGADARGPARVVGRGLCDERCYRYWPVFDAVSMARPWASFLPVTSVRM